MRGGTTEKPLLSDEYQAILTQRSIARVALHLGIDTLPSNTLTVLQDSLTQYLERVGRVLGNNVENSGRSSDHVNVLDAIRAIEDCALVNGYGHDYGQGQGHAGNGSVRGSAHATGEWGDLARFLFGNSLDNDAIVNSSSSSSSRQNGTSMNQQGHSQAQSQAQAQTQSADGSQNETQGWNAPLDDYDSIPIFPIQTGRGSRAITTGSSSISHSHSYDATNDATKTVGGGAGTISVDAQSGTGTGSGGIKSDANSNTNSNTNAISALGGGETTPSDEMTTTNPSSASAAAGGAQGTASTANGAATGTGVGPGVGVANTAGAATAATNPLSDKSSSGKKDNAKRKRESDANNGGDGASPNNKRAKSQKDDSKQGSGNDHNKDGNNANANNGNRNKESDGHNSNTDNLNMSTEHEQDAKQSTPLPSYVPNFLPPFPPTQTYTKSFRTLPPSVEAFQAQDVRSSLVQLGQSYWGAMPMLQSQLQSQLSKEVFVKVKTAQVDMSATVAAVGVNETGGAVKPVLRASNARVSRILEGSMDAHS